MSMGDKTVDPRELIRPLEAGDPTEGWPDIRLPAGTAAELIDADRGETSQRDAGRSGSRERTSTWPCGRVTTKIPC